MNKGLLEHKNTIDCLSDQIEALLDLMQMTESSVAIESIKTASEMCQTMHIELMREVEKIVEKIDGDVKR